MFGGGAAAAALAPTDVSPDTETLAETAAVAEARADESELASAGLAHDVIAKSAATPRTPGMKPRTAGVPYRTARALLASRRGLLCRAAMSTSCLCVRGDPWTPVALSIRAAT